MQIIKNITNGFNTTKRAALFYKTGCFYEDVSKYVHTNNWEIVESARILNEKGFSVDVLDRGVSNWQNNENYDLFLGLGVGPAGIHFPMHSKASGAKVKILLSLGPQPDESTRLVLERYRLFNTRHNSNIPSMRAPTTVTGEAWKRIIDATSYIFNIGEKNNASFESLLPYKKPIFNFYPSISPKVKYNKNWFKSRDRGSFLCFAGNGFICKGVDLVIDAFLLNPEKSLHICGPKSEAPFFKFYGDKINNSPNIHYHGFIEPGGELFNSLASQFVTIFHSAAEGCCTSVATTMKAGLVPIINHWTGINITNEGLLLPEQGDLVNHIDKAIKRASEFSDSEYSFFLENTLNKSTIFSQDSFTNSYRDALEEVIKLEHI